MRDIVWQYLTNLLIVGIISLESKEVGAHLTSYIFSHFNLVLKSLGK